jgi:integrase
MEIQSKGFNTTQSKGFSKNIIAPYTKSGKLRVRIFRPDELKALVKAIPKKYSKVQFEFLFYTGMRYVEAQAVKDRPDLFDGDNIHLIPKLIKKPKCTIKDRYVILNPVGKRVAEEYFKLDKPLPHWNTWRENLARWARMAGFDISHMSSKTLRKTWESYLITIYPEFRDAIFVSQGHTELVALKNYVNLPFTQEDKEKMLPFVSGWNM